VAMFEFRLDRRSGRHVLLEVNPRFWGSLPLAVAAGADFPALWWEVAVRGRPREASYRPGILKADLTGEFDRVVDRFEESTGLARLRAAAAGVTTAVQLILARRTADSWAADDFQPWHEERRMLGLRARQALARRLPGRERRYRARFEDALRKIAGMAHGRPLRLAVIGRDNVCRSAFAERLLKLRLTGLPVELASAGYVPKRSARPSPATLAAAVELGVDLAGHCSNALSTELLERADALILLDDDTEWRLRQMSPDFAAQVVVLPGIDGAGPETFPAIVAALARLAQSVKDGRAQNPRPAAAGPGAPVRQAA
jgi:protein-tyrosine-phosphatase